MPAYYPTFTSRIDGRKIDNMPKDISRFDGYKKAPKPMAVTRFNRRRMATARQPNMNMWFMYNLLGLAFFPIRRTMAAAIPLTGGTSAADADAKTGWTLFHPINISILLAIIVFIYLVVRKLKRIPINVRNLGQIFKFSKETQTQQEQEEAKKFSSFYVDLEIGKYYCQRDIYNIKRHSKKPRLTSIIEELAEPPYLNDKESYNDNSDSDVDIEENNISDGAQFEDLVEVADDTQPIILLNGHRLDLDSEIGYL